ncbi:MAG: hypothetical protein ACTHN5_09675 [Phycisphaerae bacterium]
MVRAKTIAGSREEILRAIRESPGEVIEAIVFVEDGVETSTKQSLEDVEPPTVNVPDVDYSREAMYRGPDDQ